MGVLKPGFVGNLFVAEVVAEPGDARFKAEGVQGFVADGAASGGSCFFGEEMPERLEIFSFDADVGGRCVREGLFRDGARDRVDLRIDATEVGECVEIYVRRKFADELSCLRTLKRERAVAAGFVGQRYVVHDDELFESFGELRADHRVGDAEKAIGQRLGFNFGEDAALGIEEEGNVALAGSEIFDVVGEDGVEVAGAVGAGEGEIGEIVFVDQGDGLIRDGVFALPVAEIVGKGAAEPDAEICAGGFVSLRQGRFDGG